MILLLGRLKEQNYIRHLVLTCYYIILFSQIYLCSAHIELKMS